MRRDVGAAVLLVLLVAVAHGVVLRQWWLWDDPQLLYGAIQFRAVEHFASPQAWQQQMPATFTPMLALAFETDLALFDPSPRGFYAHHLIAFALAILALYAYLRTFATPLVAFLAAAAFAVSQPAFTVATLLMDRHYAEGMIFAALALLLFRRGSAAAAVLYLVACAYKEVYVPLPLLVVTQDFVLRRGWRMMARNAALCAVTGAAYLAWRIWMLGSFGGYGGAAGRTLSAESWTVLTGSEGVASLGVLALAVLLLVLAARRAPLVAAAIVVACAVFILVPIAGLPVVDSRYFFVAAAVIVGCAALAASRAPLRSLETVAFAALCLAIASGGVRHGVGLRREMTFWQRDGLYLWNAPPGATPLFTGADGWYIEGIRWLRTAVKGDAAPDAIASMPGLVIRGLTPADVVVSAPRNAAEVMREFTFVRSSYDPDLPLQARLSRRGTVLSWSLGPAAPGDAFFLVTPIQELLWTRTPSGWVRLPADIPPTALRDRRRTVRVMRRSGERWTVSRELPFPADGATVTSSGS